ncbi:iron siderophore-binding protein [Dulcicalothrix desertica PCC 7102]|uniref:Iron siderophore-binding protein n=1 Tax=Dulcicalothrix desertica PCC 7102 TaxID=232991 RepID=A0A3S1B3W0_9CYAN|nr:iron-siderophore ABC transporter substrate-binding protein [Dulcicalothrix desertica]RUT04332.1 iron siderophore-binding protein [Dulcicalothrix desertica PCC 7102]TWH51186.1 iron complex transport system substrate-binding protein [Dulcicalothrix desertica PCC 7102]
MINHRYRYIKLFILIFLPLLLFTGCYSKVTQNSYSHKIQSAAPECRTIKHQLGEACIPIDPQRIIVVDQMILEGVLALGIKPIGAAEPERISSTGRHLLDKNKDTISIGKESQLNIEKMLQLHPDIILGLEIATDNYNLFSQIAPTVSLEYVQTAWKDTFQRLGEILGKSEQAGQALAQYQHRVEKLRAAFSTLKAKTKVSVSRFYAGLKTTEFRTSFSFPVSVIEEVGLSIPLMQRQLTTSPDQTFVQVSLERLDLLDADAMFVALDPGSEKTFKKYQNSQVWRQLNVVKNKQVYTVDSSYWIFGNLLSARTILDDLAKYLLEVK